MTLKIANGYGNVDVRQGLSKRYVHVRGERLQPLCRNRGIEYAQALVGFSGKKRYGYAPVFDGVVVSAKSAPKLLQAIEERDAKAKDPKTIAARARAKERKKAREAEAAMAFEERCDALGVCPYSRTAEWLRSGKISEASAELLAFKTMYRHEYTDYDSRFRDGEFEELRAAGMSPQEARDDMVFAARDNMRESPIPATWEAYLRFYGLDSDVAQALARTLKDPQKCHPVWFKKAEIAVRRAGLPLDGLTYEAIRQAIAREDFSGPYRDEDY